MAPHLSAVQDLVDEEELTQREREHIRAVVTQSKGNLPLACQYWTDILIKYPLGMCICLSVCLSICLSVCLSVCQSFHLLAINAEY